MVYEQNIPLRPNDRASQRIHRQSMSDRWQGCQQDSPQDALKHNSIKFNGNVDRAPANKASISKRTDGELRSNILFGRRSNLWVDGERPSFILLQRIVPKTHSVCINTIKPYPTTFTAHVGMHLSCNWISTGPKATLRILKSILEVKIHATVPTIDQLNLLH